MFYLRVELDVRAVQVWVIIVRGWWGDAYTQPVCLCREELNGATRPVTDI